MHLDEKRSNWATNLHFPCVLLSRGATFRYGTLIPSQKSVKRPRLYLGLTTLADSPSFAFCCHMRRFLPSEGPKGSLGIVEHPKTLTGAECSAAQHNEAKLSRQYYSIMFLIETNEGNGTGCFICLFTVVIPTLVPKL